MRKEIRGDSKYFEDVLRFTKQELCNQHASIKGIEETLIKFGYKPVTPEECSTGNAADIPDVHVLPATPDDEATRTAPVNKEEPHNTTTEEHEEVLTTNHDGKLQQYKLITRII